MARGCLPSPGRGPSLPRSESSIPGAGPDAAPTDSTLPACGLPPTNDDLQVLAAALGLRGRLVALRTPRLGVGAENGSERGAQSEFLTVLFLHEWCRYPDVNDASRPVATAAHGAAAHGAMLQWCHVSTPSELRRRIRHGVTSAKAKSWLWAPSARFPHNTMSPCLHALHGYIPTFRRCWSDLRLALAGEEHVECFSADCVERRASVEC